MYSPKDDFVFSEENDYFLNSSSYFLPLLDCLDLEQQVEVAKNVLENYPLIRYENTNHQLLMRFANLLASSITALTIGGM